MINSLVKLPHVKILISSRPTSEYIIIFEEVPKLAMQDLTRGCIDTCIDGKLRANRYIAGLMKTHPKETSKLLDKIAKRASGIFLWVDLACSSLLRGASGNDTLEELDKRVKALPEKLEEMFVHMLNYYNDASHKKQGAQVLEFSRDFHQTKDLDGEALGFPSEIGQHYESDTGSGWELTEPEIMAQTLARIDQHMFLSVDTDVLKDSEEIDRLVNNLEERLRMRCGGLLEVRHEDPDNASTPRQVVFIHRSVQEFLNAKTGAKYLSDHVGDDWDLSWSRNLYWIQRIADVYGWNTSRTEAFGRSGTALWLSIFNSRVWNMKHDDTLGKIDEPVQELLESAPNISRRPHDYPVEVSIQWRETAACPKASSEVRLSCLHTALSFLAPYHADPEAGLRADEDLRKLIPHSQTPDCDCLPPLIFAVDQLVLILFQEAHETLEEEARLLRGLITCLVEYGADFNQEVSMVTSLEVVQKAEKAVEEDGKVVKKAGKRVVKKVRERTTPWKHFIGLLGSQIRAQSW